MHALIGDRSPADIFSWKSPSFRKMGIDRDSLDDDRMIALMLEEPRLIRRPVTAIGDTLIVGADSKATFPGSLVVGAGERRRGWCW